MLAKCLHTQYVMNYFVHFVTAMQKVKNYNCVKK